MYFLLQKCNPLPLGKRHRRSVHTCTRCCNSTLCNGDSHCGSQGSDIPSYYREIIIIRGIPIFVYFVDNTSQRINISTNNCHHIYIYIVKPVYKGHLRLHENVSFMSSCPLKYRLKLYALFINGKMRLSFMDSDLLFRGVVYGQ